MYVIPSHLVGHNWDEQIRRWVQRLFRKSKYSCSGRCGVDERDASISMPIKDLPKCFCDKLCDEFGDCCFDFNEL